MIQLTIEPDPANLMVMRSTAGAIAARAGLTLDQIDDVRTAVEEAGVILLQANAPLIMRADHTVAPFTVEVAADTGSTVEVDTESLAWIVLTAMADRVDVTDTAGRTAVVLSFQPVGTTA